MKTRLSTVALLATLLVGCATPPLTGTGAGGGTTRPSSTIVDPVTGKPVPNLALEALNGVEFKPLTQGTAQYLANNGGGVIAAGAGNAVATKGATAPAAAPAPTMASTGGASMVAEDAAVSRSSGGSGGNPSQAGGAFSGNVWSNYGYNYYFGYGFGGGTDQMALVSLQEGETAGASGSFADLVAKVAGPIVKVWAQDGRLVQSGAVLANDGSVYVDQDGDGASDMPMTAKIAPGPQPWYENGNAWRLVYVSSDRKEVLNFTITPEKTTIVRMRWAPLDLTPERVKTDSATAVRSLIAAIQDKGFKGEEEKTMKDYFMGYAFEQPKTGEWDGDYQKTEVLYEVPKDARWNVSLQQVMGKLVWQLDWGAQWNRPVAMAGATVAVAPRPAVMVDDQGEDTPAYCAPITKPQEPDYYVNYYGQGMVDAETGAVIRFTRPTKVTYSYPQPEPAYDCKPMPGPSLTPTPTPSAAATASPEPTASPTPADDGDDDEAPDDAQ